MKKWKVFWRSEGRITVWITTTVVTDYADDRVQEALLTRTAAKAGIFLVFFFLLPGKANRRAVSFSHPERIFQISPSAVSLADTFHSLSPSTLPPLVPPPAGGQNLLKIFTILAIPVIQRDKLSLDFPLGWSRALQFHTELVIHGKLKYFAFVGKQKKIFHIYLLPCLPLVLVPEHYVFVFGLYVCICSRDFLHRFVPCWWQVSDPIFSTGAVERAWKVCRKTVEITLTTFYFLVFFATIRKKMLNNADRNYHYLFTVAEGDTRDT